MKKNFAIICTAILVQFFSFATEQTNESFFQKVEESAQWIKEKISVEPQLLVVLTANVSGPEDLLTDVKELTSTDIPNFPAATVPGHEGKIVFGKLNGKEIALFKGRYHYYEGLSPQEVVFPYFVMNALGVQSVITVNAVGGIRPDLNAGDIMLVTDHINGMYNNPLIGIAMHKKESPFTDMTSAYNSDYQKIATDEAKKLDIPLKEGVYLSTSGPNYETRSEIKMFRTWGADAVGMSTVFEVIACNFLDMKVLTFCCIANPAADRHTGNMSHEEVLEALQAAAPKLSALITSCAEQITR